MFRKLLIVFILITVVLATGCDNRYYDEHMQMEVKRLDSDLDNRWSTSGVVINRISPNGPADKAQLSTGELISYIIGEYTIQNAQEYAHAVKKAMKHDSNMLLYIKGKEPLRIATRKLGDKVGLQVEGNGTVRIKQITPGTPAANSDDIQIGDVIEKIVDERKIFSLNDYKKSVNEFAQTNTSITLRTTELIGVKIASVTALGNLGDARAVDALIDILQNNRELALRKAAARSLERLVALSELNPLFQKFQAEDVNQLPADMLDVRQRESAEILGLLLVDLKANTATLEAPFGIQFRHRSASLHQKVSAGRLVALAEKYIHLDTEPEQEIRRACLSMLGTLKPVSSIEPLVKVLRDQNEIPGIRFQAGLALSLIGEPAIDALIAAFNEADAAAKDIAASALGRIGGIQTRDFLINALETPGDPAIQLTLVDAIAKIGDEPSLSALERQRDRFQEGDSAIRIFLDEVFSSLATPAQ
ncbi:hypothetical protein F4X73_00995 [Candidatus Poribacteria bacterium]|nr:hypothetical protein [Candidatus Poribacteria bacterium]MYB63239.1 hypothetical protein [Candidatus Poribacteria bacterium]